MTAVRERNDRADEWTAQEELLAQIVDQLAILRIEAYRLAGVPGWKLPKPYRVRRPGEKADQEMVVTPSEFARLTVVN